MSETIEFDSPFIEVDSGESSVFKSTTNLTGGLPVISAYPVNSSSLLCCTADDGVLIISATSLNCSYWTLEIHSPLGTVFIVIILYIQMEL